MICSNLRILISSLSVSLYLTVEFCWHFVMEIWLNVMSTLMPLLSEKTKLVTAINTLAHNSGFYIIWKRNLPSSGTKKNDYLVTFCGSWGSLQQWGWRKRKIPKPWVPVGTAWLQGSSETDVTSFQLYLKHIYLGLGFGIFSSFWVIFFPQQML